MIRAVIMFLLAIAVSTLLVLVVKADPTREYARLAPKADYGRLTDTMVDRIDAMRGFLPRIEQWSVCSDQRYADKCDMRVKYFIYVDVVGNVLVAPVEWDYRDRPELKKFIIRLMKQPASSFYDGACTDGPCLFQ